MDTFKDILAAQATTVAKEINDLQKLPIDAAAPLVAMIQQSKSWTPELKQSLCSTINLKVEETMSGKKLQTNRRELQDFVYFPYYMTAADWETVLKDEPSNIAQKCTKLMDRLYSLGLRAPSEHTMAMITTALLLQDSTRFQDSLQLRSSYLTIKGMVKTYLKNKMEDPTPDLCVKTLPPSPEVFLVNFEGTFYKPNERPGPLPQGVTMQQLLELQQLVPERSNRRTINVPLAKAVPMQDSCQMVGQVISQMFLAQMAAQQGRQAHPSNAFGYQPHQVTVEMNKPQPALPPPVASVAPTAPMAPMASGAPPEILVVKAPPPQPSPLALTDGKADEEPKAPEETKAPEKQVDKTTALTVNENLEAALQQRDADKKMGKDNQEKQGEKDDQKNQEPESNGEKKQPVLKRPAAKKAKAKPKSKPAAKPKAVPKPKVVPKPKTSPVKRPASSFEQHEVTHSKGKIPPRKLRLYRKPMGCSKCRWVPGCCDSCWVQRGFHR